MEKDEQVEQDVAKIVNENIELKTKVKELENYIQTLKRYAQTDKENIDELWDFVKPHLTLERIEIVLKNELPNRFQGYKLVEFRPLSHNGSYLFLYKQEEKWFKFELLKETLIKLLNKFQRDKEGV